MTDDLDSLETLLFQRLVPVLIEVVAAYKREQSAVGGQREMGEHVEHVMMSRQHFWESAFLRALHIDPDEAAGVADAALEHWRARFGVHGIAAAPRRPQSGGSDSESAPAKFVIVDDDTPKH